MRKQTEFRTYPPLSSSAGWGAGRNDNKDGDQRPSEQELAGYSRAGRIATLLVACLMLLAAPAASATSKPDLHKASPPLQQLLAALDPSTVVDVIVQYQVTPQQKHLDLVTSRGGWSKRHLGVIKAEAYTLPLSAVQDLLDDADVAHVSLDHTVKLTSNFDAPREIINTDIAQSYGYDGTGVGIAIVDSGLYAHPDLNVFGASNSRVVYSQSFVTGDSSTADAYGHGTHVAGLAAGDAQSSQGKYKYEYTGVAPNASIINLRVLDANGYGTDSAVIAAISQAIALKSKYNIRVLNLSLGRGIYESYTVDPLCQAVEQAWNAGIVVVVAAGNNGRDNSMNTHGYGTIGAPGNDPYVITVGALDDSSSNRANDAIASYSSKGPTLIDHIVKPDLVAPGNKVVSLLAPGATLVNGNPSLDVFPCNNSGTDCGAQYGSSKYFTLSGTSMATPLVSGAAALMLQKNPTLTPDLVKARLMKSAYKNYQTYSSSADYRGNVYNNQSDIFTYGAGYLDAAAALNNSDTGSGLALSPTAVYNPSTNTVTITQTAVSGASKSVLWGTSILWGTSLVWGNNVFLSGSSILWGSSVVWGSSTASGFSILWGSSILWGTTMQGMSAGDPGDCTVTSTAAVTCQ